MKLPSTELREVAETLLSKQPSSLPASSPNELDKDALIQQLKIYQHELQVHQIELQVQNGELQRSNLELEVNRDKYQDLYNHAPIGYFSLTDGGVITEVNATGADQLGVARDRLVGRRFALFVHETSRTHFAAFLRRVFETRKPGRVELQLLLADGQLFHAQLDARLTHQADPQTVRVTLVDITPLKHAQDTISALNTTLEERVEARTAQIRELNLELESFVQSVTHDLQTPLRQIESFTALFNAQPHADTAPHYLQGAAQAASQIHVLLDALASYFQIGRQRARFGPVDLNKVLGEVKKDLQPQLAVRTVEWRQAVLPTVQGDSRSLQLLFWHLLDNALKFSHPQTLIAIRITTQETETEQIISVGDNGIGFPMRQRDRLFGVFQRFHPQREYEGLGMGLALVKRIVLRHGGRVWAEGKENQGATFSVAFPKHPPVHF